MVDLADAIEAAVRIPVGLKWHAIPKYDNSYHSDDVVQAVTLECPQGSGQALLQALRPFYSAKPFIFPPWQSLLYRSLPQYGG